MEQWNLTIGNEKQVPVINLFYANSRYRYWTGRAIGLKLTSHDNPELLKAAFELKLIEGWRPTQKTKQEIELIPTVVDILNRGIRDKISQGCSERYVKDAKRVAALWKRFERENNIRNIGIDKLSEKHLSKFIIRPSWGPKTQRTIKSTLSPLLSMPKLTSAIKLHKPLSKLNKPIDDISEVINEIKQYNSNLHLCCLLTYGCLLRPHREIRELTWGDFTSDLNYIKLSGERNKSGRNRIVPVPRYIREILVKGESGHNIFTALIKPPNPDYFKTLWSRFKRVSGLIEQDQTLYSFRHSGAIDIFKRTGSITKLQKAMGHSSINVSLTYLRGLEVPELNEEDMPMI
jgi:integrase